jgi:glucose-1-phosphate thymidylyltransferase
MKGIILAGGFGSRLKPLTEVTNKHLLPVYNQPMIFYPLQTLLRAGIKDIMIVASPDHVTGFMKLLGSGERFDANFYFAMQETAGGIAQALGRVEQFVGDDSVAVILGDNIFEDDFSDAIASFTGGATLFLKEVDDAKRFGVAELDGDKIIGIEEKPAQPKSKYAVTGLYLYESSVFDVVKNLKPSARGELEITDVNNHFVELGVMDAVFLDGVWTDAGTFESLYRATTLARDLFLRSEGRSPRSLSPSLSPKLKTSHE